MIRKYIVVPLFLSSLHVVHAREIDFNRDIRPILSDKCFHCHGQDATNQKSEFRLDTPEHAVQDLGGYAGIVPGNLKQSEVHARIHLPKDDDDAMPPLNSNRMLSPKEIELLDQWIQQGAKYDLHWAFKKVERPAVPTISASNTSWAKNPVDHFVAARLEEEGLSPSPQADLETLFRRASITLTGLPPTTEALSEALNGDPANAYNRHVEQLLASMDYAERQALRWLDAARYADTDGYQNDGERKNWPWRDWVIQAFHDNMPFDQFTIEQIAGDMLPNASPQQILASAFNRNHRQNSEGGALAKEFFVENVIDRVETTSTVWLGLTMGCARCHDHKYDPLTQKEFYQMFAFFNNIGEKGIGKGVSANPILKVGSPLAVPPDELVSAKAAAEKAEADAKQDLAARRNAWINRATEEINSAENGWTFLDPVAFKVTGDGALSKESDKSLLFHGQNVAKVNYHIDATPKAGTITGFRIDALPHPSFSKPRQLSRSVNGNFVLSEVQFQVRDGTNPVKPIGIGRAAATFSQDKYPVANAIDGKGNTGWAIYSKTPKPEAVSALFAFEKPVDVAAGDSVAIQLSHSSTFADHNIGRFKIFLTGEDTPDFGGGTGLGADVVAALERPAEVRSDAERKTIDDYYATLDGPTLHARKLRAKYDAEMVKKGFAQVPVMVMRERDGDRLPAYVLDRGQYDAPNTSTALNRAVPASLFSGKLEDQPQDRLEFARWLVGRENPLTARVLVNRIWQDHFGHGLVKTSEDFGTQGEYPSHPELLDWLSVELMESGWDVKALHRLIVSSATYQQRSVVTEELLKRDPHNRLLARGPRYRMDGFSIRDAALQAAGLLNRRAGGPPVKPYQPQGLWNVVASNGGTRYKTDSGGDLYRKSMYTYWKRAVNPPRQLIFDAAGREACNVNVRRTNTPLQALVLMNDVTFIEAARNIAEGTLNVDPEDAQGLRSMYLRTTAQRAGTETLLVLQDNLKYFREHFLAQASEAEAFVSAGASPRDNTIEVSELAAWTAVAHLILNLDVTISVE